MALSHGMTGVEGEENMQARIERLGRQRPTKFKTLWTEIGFCSSLLASMVMAVSSIPHPRQCQHLPLITTPGVLRQWLQRYPANSSNRPRYSASIPDMARERILSRHRRFSTSIWPPG